MAQPHKKTKAPRKAVKFGDPLHKTTHLDIVQIIEYLVSGGLYFWTGYAVFFVCFSVFGWNLWWAKLTANILGWTANFLMQRYWVFSNPVLNKHRTEVTGRYIVITLVDFVLDYVIVYLLQMVGISPYIGQFVSAGFFTVWNYFWYKTWVFTSRFHRKHKHHAV